MRYWRIVATDPPVEGVGRNNPCPCGSGKKFKKCHGNKKARQRTITFDFGRPLRPDEIDGVAISPNGEAQLLRSGVPLQPLSVETKESYEREGKSAKVLYRFAGGALRGGTNPNVLLEKYQHVFAIDTNTVAKADGDVSVAAVVEGVLSVEDNKLVAETVDYGRWHCKGLPFPERAAWRVFLEHLISKGITQSRVALIVDHDLQNLDAYNRRTKPIHEDFFLPENVELIYATEGGTDFYGARLIRLCHQEASRELRRLVA